MFNIKHVQKCKIRDKRIITAVKECVNIHKDAAMLFYEH